MTRFLYSASHNIIDVDPYNYRLVYAVLCVMNMLHVQLICTCCYMYSLSNKHNNNNYKKCSSFHSQNTSSPHLLEVHISYCRKLRWWTPARTERRWFRIPATNCVILASVYTPQENEACCMSSHTYRRMCLRTSNFLPQMRGWLISLWQKFIRFLVISLPRLPHVRS